jgi:hypothetical protein
MNTVTLPLPYAISPRILLAVYAIVPFLFLVILADRFFWDDYLKGTLTMSTTTTALYVLFLEVPHIIGSFIGYADTEYLNSYRRKLFVHLPILCIATYVLASFQFALLFLGYLIYTMYHALRQQMGIAKLLLNNPHTVVLHRVWGIAGISAGSIGSLYVYKPYIVDWVAEYITFELLTGVTVVSAGLSLWYLLRTWKKSIGWMYLLATIVLLLGMYGALFLGYLFFAILMIRFVHDVTAFIFYAVHDGNRNSETVRNSIYSILKPIGIPLLLTTPLLAVVVAYVLRTHTPLFTQGAYAVMLIGFVHYYIEGFMWKYGSLHRSQIRFSDGALSG